MIYQDKNEEVNKPILEKFAVKAFPTFVITDAEGTELSRSVGAPFSTAEDARKWFPKTADALANLTTYEAAHKEKPEDVDAGLKLADAYGSLGRNADAIALYEKFGAKLEKTDKRYVDMKLGHADALMGTMDRKNQMEVLGKMRKIYDEVLPDLVKAKDERAVEPGILNARIKDAQKEHADGRKDLKALIEAYPKSDRLKEMKFWSALLATNGDEKEAGIAELEALVKEGPEDDQWVKAATSTLTRLKK